MISNIVFQLSSHEDMAKFKGEALIKPEPSVQAMFRPTDPVNKSILVYAVISNFSFTMYVIKFSFLHLLGTSYVKGLWVVRKVVVSFYL